MSSVVDQLLSLPAWSILLVTAALVFAEDSLFVGFVLPAETVVVLAGVAASQHHVSLTLLLVTVVAAAIIGDSVGYEVGRHLGTRLLKSHFLDSRRERLDQAQALLARRGGSAVFLGRFIAFFRAVMPTLAGTAGMPYRTFLLFNAAGGLVWGTGAVLVGYFAGASYQHVESLVGRWAAVAVVVLVVLALGGWLLRARRREDQA
jgi:membrane-associated protein